MIEDPEDVVPEGDQQEDEEPRIPTVGGPSEEPSPDIQEEEPMGTSTSGNAVEIDVETRVSTADSGVPDHLSADVENPVERRTWSSYNDPTAAATGARLQEERETQEKQGTVEGSAYRFMGHTDRYNETRELVTSYGRVKIGQDIKLPDDELARLRGFGFRFDQVAPSS